MTDPLFDDELRARRRDRAARGGETGFLLQRAFDDIVERLSFVQRDFGKLLMIGCPDPAWKARLQPIASGEIDVIDPGPLFAQAAGGRAAREDRLDSAVGDYDLCIAIGTLDTVNDLPQALLRLRLALAPGALCIGALAGGDTLPRLRSAMRAADRCTGAATPHVHPRIEPAALAALLSAAGFVEPVVDVDRVQASYASFGDLVRDLRSMAATNVLTSRSKRPLTRAALAAAERDFRPEEEERTVENFEILHFAAWTAAEPGDSRMTGR